MAGVVAGDRRQVLRGADRVHGRHRPAPGGGAVRHDQHRPGSGDGGDPGGHPDRGADPRGPRRPLRAQAGVHRRDGAARPGPGGRRLQPGHPAPGGLPVCDRSGPRGRLPHGPPGDLREHPGRPARTAGAGGIQLPGRGSGAGHGHRRGGAGHRSQAGGLAHFLSDPGGAGEPGAVGTAVPAGEQPLAGEQGADGAGPGPAAQTARPQ